MDFEIPEEYRELVDIVRRFRERELMPLEHRFLSDGKLGADTWVALQEKGRQYHLWALDVPEKHGGQGLGELAMVLVAEELFKHPAMFEFGGSPEPALYSCNEDQMERYFHPVVRGERRSCYAFTEPDTGSDFARIRTTAVRDGDGWRISGRKTFISHVDRADFIILFASTDPAQRSRGVSAFLVDVDSAGLTISRPIPTMGDDWEPYELDFDNCYVPDANRLGPRGGGWQIGSDQLTHGRLRIAAYQLGIAQRCLELAVDWAKHRVTWDKPIGSRQAIQWMLADSEVELEAARLLTYRAAWMTDNGKETRNEVFMAKLYAAEMSGRVTDRAMQVFGGLGYTKELPIQSFYRQARLWRIGHGTSEIHRWMIARNLLGDVARD